MIDPGVIELESYKLARFIEQSRWRSALETLALRDS